MARTQRNTPTCVGKTRGHHCRHAIKRKHPHVRGEDPAGGLYRLRHLETPPRAWGRLRPKPPPLNLIGNTPTCVGKTFAQYVSDFVHRKHPHVRGEDQLIKAGTFNPEETPPRAWGRLWKLLCPAWTDGNTPTCVGKTQSPGVRNRDERKHPHVRGEDTNILLKSDSINTRYWF